MTEKLYYMDSHIREFTAAVLLLGQIFADALSQNICAYCYEEAHSLEEIVKYYKAGLL